MCLCVDSVLLFLLLFVQIELKHFYEKEKYFKIKNMEKKRL
jgi:hypothetical protein